MSNVVAGAVYFDEFAAFTADRYALFFLGIFFVLLGVYFIYRRAHTFLFPRFCLPRRAHLRIAAADTYICERIAQWRHSKRDSWFFRHVVMSTDAALRQRDEQHPTPHRPTPIVAVHTRNDICVTV